jgi:hypothetical protein
LICPPRFNVVPEIGLQRRQVDEAISHFVTGDMLVVAFAGFVVISQYANTIGNQHQAVLVVMLTAGYWPGHMPNDSLNERCFRQDLALAEQQFGFHVGEHTIAHKVLGSDEGSRKLTTPALRALRSRLPFGREDFALRSDSDLAQLAAIRAGYGIGACQCALARRDRNLVHVLPEAFALDLDTWLVMHEDLRASRRVRLVYDYLVQALAAYAETPV